MDDAEVIDNVFGLPDMHISSSQQRIDYDVTHGINEETGQDTIPLPALRLVFAVFGTIYLLEITYTTRISRERSISETTHSPATKEKLLP